MKKSRFYSAFCHKRLLENRFITSLVASLSEIVEKIHLLWRIDRLWLGLYWLSLQIYPGIRPNHSRERSCTINGNTKKSHIYRRSIYMAGSNSIIPQII